MCMGAFAGRSCDLSVRVRRAFRSFGRLAKDWPAVVWRHQDDRVADRRCALTYAALCAAVVSSQGLALGIYFVCVRRCEPWQGFLVFALVTVLSEFAVSAVRPPDDDEI